ncbi:MAG: putative entry exclusion protein TrbK-alt [Allosphingosinicella sp.]|uniref:putative entry exclusion protein TrbK-alt n=1 Tax=Allosphingosinicella sp. TaxID=2823234 RepID=UPI00395001D5
MLRRAMRERLNDGPNGRRVVLVMAVGALLSAVAAWLTGVDATYDARPVPAVVQRPADPLQSALHRCNGMGQAALDDPTCRAAWAENRRRFFVGRPATEGKEPAR